MAGQETEKSTKFFGGPCEYRIFQGKAKIVSIKEQSEGQGKNQAGCPRVKVRFVFYPEEEIGPSWVQVKGKEFVLFLTNGWLPNRKFLKKYNIEKNRFFACNLKVITQGSCTPLIFDFPGIDLSDYQAME